jgi:DNA-binding transcriptional LysR family regulator
VTRFESVVHYVRAGAGLGIVPAGALPLHAADDFHAAALIEPSLSVTLGIITRRGRYMTPVTTGLIDVITDNVRNIRAVRPRGRALSRPGAA